MTDFNFKVGDKVYIPSEQCTIQTVVGTKAPYLFKVGDYTIYASGYDFRNTDKPAGALVFPATQEWYDKLVHVYPDLEEPPTEKTAKEIIRLMEEAGHKFITCKAKDPNSNLWEIVVALGICSYCSPKSSSDYMYDSFGSSYFEFYPINSKGQKIIDFVDGEMILED